MALHQSTICMGCWEHLHLPVPLRGVVSVPFRAFGIRPSRMNPNTCTMEFTLRDPDGYYVMISALSAA